MGTRGWKVLCEAGVCALFALVAFAHHCGATKGLSPNPLLGGDAGFIASWAAALDHPERFRGDEVLGEEGNFAVYSSCHLHVPLVRWLASGGRDYGSAFASLVGLHVFLQAIGFYLLGRVLTRSRFWAALYALITLMPMEVGHGDIEVWGVLPDPLPRFTFQALVPFLLAAAIRWRARPWTWIGSLACMGLLMYVHPASAPVMGLAVWMGIWCVLPRGWSWGRRIAVMLLLGLLFLAFASLSFLPYLVHHTHGAPVGVTYEQAMQVMHREYEDVLSPTRAFLTVLRAPQIRWYGWALAAIGLGAVRWFRRSEPSEVDAVWLWVVGILLASVAIPWAEHAVEEHYQWVPVELDLVRGLRYLVPFILLFALWPLAELSRRWGWRAAVPCMVVGLLMGAHWVRRHKPPDILAALQAWRHGSLYPSPDQDVVEAMSALRDRTPEGARVFTATNRMAIRYFAFRPIVWCTKDGAILAYSNLAAALRWERVYERVPPAGTQQRLDIMVALAKELGADCLLVEKTPSGVDAARAGVLEVWSNHSYSLLMLNGR